MEDETITAIASGDYPTWIHNGLFEALSAALNEAVNCTQVTNMPTCSFTEG